MPMTGALPLRILGINPGVGIVAGAGARHYLVILDLGYMCCVAGCFGAHSALPKRGRIRPRAAAQCCSGALIWGPLLRLLASPGHPDHQPMCHLQPAH